MILRLLPRAVGAFLLLSALLRAAPEPIRVGHFASLTGKEASFGVAGRKGIELAVAELNAAGGVLGRPVEYLVEDIQSKAGESATAVKKLVARDKVVAVLGANASSNSLEAAPICQAAHVPMIALSSTSPKVTAMGTYIFRVCFIDPFQGAVLAKFARTTLHAKRVALLTSATAPYSVGLSGVFRERFTADGGEIVAEQKYAEGDKDFRAQLTAIRTFKPDVIAATGPIRGNDQLGLGIVISICDGIGTETAKNDRMSGANASAGQHGNRQFRDHRHIKCHAIAGCHAQFLQNVGELADFAMKILVSQDSAVSRFTFPDNGRFVFSPSGQVPIQAVVAGIDLSTDKPLGFRHGALDHVVPLFEPVQVLSKFAPEPRGIIFGSLPHLLVLSFAADVGLLREFSRRGERAGFLQDALNVT